MKIKNKYKKRKFNSIKNNTFLVCRKYFKFTLLVFFIIVLFFIIYYFTFNFKNISNNESNKKLFLNHKVGIFKLNDIPPEQFERNVLDGIKDKIKFKSLLSINELYFY